MPDTVLDAGDAGVSKAGPVPALLELRVYGQGLYSVRDATARGEVQGDLSGST